MATVTVSIGRNVGSQPMSDNDWTNFISVVGASIKRDANAVFVDAAASRGEWDGIAEDSRTWVADIDEWDLGALRGSLAEWARTFMQDAIAFTVGATELVNPRG